MRLVKIQDVFELQDGETVPAVRGRITAVYKPVTGTNSNGDWSFQNIELDDGTGKIKAKLKDRDALDERQWKGKLVVIACHDGEKGLSGVKATDDTYKEKTSRILWVTKSAHIDLASPEQAAPQPAHAPKGAPSGADHQNGGGNGHAPAPASGKPGAKVGLLRLANLYLMCLDAGSYVAKQYGEKTGADMTGEQYQACVSSLFIQANKDGLAEQVPYTI